MGKNLESLGKLGEIFQGNSGQIDGSMGKAGGNQGNLRQTGEHLGKSGGKQKNLGKNEET